MLLSLNFIHPKQYISFTYRIPKLKPTSKISYILGMMEIMAF